ncbi:MAG: MBL fold metallo-hydrolase [Thermotogae bacterium]|nr:MAG: MBL fold metallo-hydrolase [Thermotogota bacterium]
MNKSHFTVTILVDNTTYTKGTLAEHGFSALIEVLDKKILFDTGSTDILLKNSQILGKNLHSISCVALSHGHYDHTGGLSPLLARIKKEVQVFAHPDIFSNHCSTAHGEKITYAGIPVSREELERLGARFEFNDKPVEILPSVFLTGVIPRENDFEDVDSALCTDNLKPDPLLDDQSLFLTTDKGVIVITGCAHSGLVNTLEYIRQVSGKEILAVLGGTHLIRAEKVRIEKTVQYLKKLHLKAFIPCHCTGIRTLRYLHEAQPTPGYVGISISEQQL